MRKIIFLISTVLALTTFSGVALAAETTDFNQIEEVGVVDTTDKSNEEKITEEINEKQENSGDDELSEASKEVIGAVTKKDKKIAELSDKYNDKFLGAVAYYLDVIRYYSTPIFFIFLTIGAFNFFIVGNKKLDKKEQGFGWITACIIGWVVFQCIPLVFALFAI